jgi:hypothetical protein
MLGAGTLRKGPRAHWSALGGKEGTSALAEDGARSGAHDRPSCSSVTSGQMTKPSDSTSELAPPAGVRKALPGLVGGCRAISARRGATDGNAQRHRR